MNDTDTSNTITDDANSDSIVVVSSIGPDSEFDFYQSATSSSASQSIKIIPESDSMSTTTTTTMQQQGGGKLSVTPNTSTSSSVFNSVVTLNHERECFYLETELSNLKAQLNFYKNENSLLKSKLDSLVAKKGAANSMSKSTSITNSVHEPFVDVKDFALIEKIEYCLTETDAVFTDESRCKPAVEYLLKSLWSIVAQEYNEKNLNKLKLVRDSLLDKLARTGELLATNGESVHKIECEFDNLKRDTLTLKQKVDNQNKFIKSLLETLPASLDGITFINESVGNEKVDPETTTTTPKTAPIEITKVADKANESDNDENEEDESQFISPSVSPSISYERHLNNLLSIIDTKRVDKRAEANSNTSTAENGPSGPSVGEDTLKHEEAQPSTTTNEQTDTRDLYVFNSNGFMLVDTNLDRHRPQDESPEQQLQLQQQQQQQASNPETTTSQQAIMKATIIYNDSSDPVLYSCPKCHTSIDTRQIKFEDFKVHTESCDPDHNLVCMFCLQSFSKRNENDYIEHVNRHVN